MKYLVFAACLLISVTATADEANRQVKIAKIIEAQGIHKMFQQQIDQQTASAKDIGANLYRKILTENGLSSEQADPKVEQIFTRYIERCVSMFSAKEFVEIWSRYYGKNLSEADLEKILAYYTSPVGKKDVAASQAAMAGFSQVITVEMQKRMESAVEQLMRELKEALGA